MHIRVFGFPLVAFLAVCLVPATALARPVELDDLYNLRTVAEPRLSPDGKWVAYTVTTADRERDEDTSDLWMVSWNGRETVRLTSSPESEHRPRWSPDGRYLAFLSSRGQKDETDQIWLLDRRGGEARQITSQRGGVSDLAWSPEGRRLVFVSEVSPEQNDDAKPKPIVVDRFHFKQDIIGYLGPERSHLFLLDVKSGDLVQLTEGDFNEVHPAWSPDGALIAFVTKRGEDPDRHENWDVYIMAPRRGAAARQVTTNPGTDGDPHGDWGSGPPRWSPDSERIAYLHGGAPEDLWYGLLEIAVITAAGSRDEQQPARTLDRNTLNPQWSDDGKQLYFLLEDDQSVQLARVRLRDGRIERLTEAGRTVSDFHVGPDGKIALISSTPTSPAEVSALDGNALRSLSRHNEAWLRNVELASTEAIDFESNDGTSIHGLLVKPAGFRSGVRYPALLRIHGGPVGQYQQEFDFEWQWFAANGYVVIAPNPRGSSGRGYAFQRSLFGEWGHVDLPDVLAAVDHAVQAGIADPDRLGVGGWSYGGILTNYVIASDKRFKAAVSGSGMSNMLGGYGIDQYVRDWELELGLPWENTAQWLRLSYPFLHANRIKTPTLFLCGSLDFNVPLVASEQMYQALRRLGVPTQLVIYPDQYHSLDRVSFQYDKWKRYVEWYDRFIKEAAE